MPFFDIPLVYSKTHKCQSVEIYIWVRNLCGTIALCTKYRSPYSTFHLHIWYTFIIPWFWSQNVNPTESLFWIFFFLHFFTFSGTVLEWTHQQDLKLSCNAKLWSLYLLWWMVVCCDATICGSEKPRYYDDASLWRLWNFINHQCHDDASIAMKQEVFVPYPISPKFHTYDNSPGLRKYTCHSHCATYCNSRYTLCDNHHFICMIFWRCGLHLIYQSMT